MKTKTFRAPGGALLPLATAALLAVAGAAAVEELLARSRRPGLAGHAWRGVVTFAAIAAFATSALARAAASMSAASAPAGSSLQ